MPLRDLQRAIADSILSEHSAPLAPLIREDGLAFDRRIQIYRNNTFISLTEALKTTFPVVCQLVDDRFFNYAAHTYIRERPPRVPCLSEFGADFADFLAGFAPAQHLVYLPDVARLEWAINSAYHAPDAPTLDPARIGAAPMGGYPRFIFVLHPSCRLLASDQPVSQIWRAHQPDGDLADIDLSAGGCRLLIDRHDADVRMLPLDRPGFAFVAALAEARPLQDAYESAAAVDAAFDLTGALRVHLSRGTFTDFVNPDHAKGCES